jgi:uncharacterized repeat protein (TIGR02543 family)
MVDNKYSFILLRAKITGGQFMNFRKMFYVFFVLVFGVFASCGSDSPVNPTYTVTYDGNTNTGGAVPTDATEYEEGATVTVLGKNTLVKDGNTFVGWNTASDGSGTALLVGDTFEMGAANVVLYAQWGDLAVGDAYEGGIVAYICTSSDACYVMDETHGLIAAVSDNHTGSGAEWGCQATEIGGTSTDLGSGQANTTAILAGCSTDDIAALVCDDYINTDTGTGVYMDWFLPSKDELDKFYQNRLAVGGFSIDRYWSSSEGSDVHAWYQYFDDDGNQNVNLKANNFSVRCARAF